MSDTEVLEPVKEETPDDTGLPAALAKAAPRRWTNRATPVLFCLVLLAGGFLGGVLVQKEWGKTTTAAAQTPRQGGGLPSGGPGFPPGPGQGEATTGTLTSVTANTLTLQTSAGRTVTVKIAETTKVLQTTTLPALRTGSPVTVQGSTATDGTITATEVSGS
jgi:uncharacterized protein DUF5666